MKCQCPCEPKRRRYLHLSCSGSRIFRLSHSSLCFVFGVRHLNLLLGSSVSVNALIRRERRLNRASSEESGLCQQPTRVSQRQLALQIMSISNPEWSNRGLFKHPEHALLLCTVLQFLVSFISSVGVFAERTNWPLSTLCSVKQAQPASPPASQSVQPATTQAQLNQAAESERPTRPGARPSQQPASQPGRQFCR